MNIDYWCDLHIYHSLTRPGMYFIGSEALVHSVLTLCRAKQAHAGQSPRSHPAVVMRQLGILQGNTVTYPDEITDELTDELREVALREGYDPRDFDEKDNAVQEHLRLCLRCSMGEPCPKAKELNAWRTE